MAGLMAWVLGFVVLWEQSAWGQTPDRSATVSPDPSDAKVKILLIGHQPDHPPGTHLYLDMCELLAKCLRRTPGVEAVVSDGWPQDPAVLEGVSGIVLYSSPGAEILLEGAAREQCEAMLKRGAGLVALHWATGIRDQNNQALADRYLAQLGGLFSFGYSGLDVSASRVEQIDASHPVCRGWQGFELTDEYYLNLKFLPEAQPLLRVPVKGQLQTVGWVYERPNAAGGRSYGNTLGHFEELFRQEAFRKMLVNGILWTVHVEVPPDGADCRL
ncbi:MAG: ThuA domain-containing protein [Pirellulaceae bacterium]|jgi:type 1 glutamine amidotransferase|nr:ThuA domain-containing protein [Pirellulaceae bacterium]